MSDSLESKLNRLETLFAEQDHTIQTLNDVVAQQDQEISQLNISIEMLRNQLLSLKTELSSDINPDTDKPPHY